MRRLLALFLALMLFLPAAHADKQPIPEALRFTQQVQNRENVRTNLYIQRTYPVTANAQINADMRALIDEMTETARPFLPTGKITIDKSYLRVGANITRTGQSWMSFLTVANVKHNYVQPYVAFDARAYDIATGQRLTMGFAVPDIRELPDQGCNFELYMHKKFLEMETLGTITEITPGESASHWEIWKLEEM